MAVSIRRVADKQQAQCHDVKAYVSAAVAIVAIILAYWTGSSVRAEFGSPALFTAVFMIVAVWIFPEVVEKSKYQKKTFGENSATLVLNARHYCCSAECLLLVQSGHADRSL